jgi:hypothetical protein
MPSGVVDSTAGLVKIVSGVVYVNWEVVNLTRDVVLFTGRAVCDVREVVGIITETTE